MNRQQKKELRQRQTSRQLMGIRQLTDHGAKTAGGELVFFMVRPDNLSVLSGEGIRGRVKRLTDLLCAAQEVRLLALDSRESFRRNKDWYRQRLEQEELPAIRRLLEQDSKHLDRIQVLMASSREFYIIIRLRSEKETDVFPYLSRIEQSINDNGFTTRRASEQDLKRMLGVYFEQNVTTEKFEDHDGDRWVIVGE